MQAYEGWFNSWWGIQDATKPAMQDSTLWITDGDTTVKFAMYDCEYGVGHEVPVPEIIQSGWGLIGPSPWLMRTAELKGGGYRSNPATAHGQFLRQAVFDQVTESWTTHLRFYSTDGLVSELDRLDLLLKVKAVEYWTERRNHTPVYVKRQLPGETNCTYALVSNGSATLSNSMWSAQCTLDTGYARPVLVSFIRQPFWLGAPPGETQSALRLSTLQTWNYNVAWAVDSALPAGQVFCFVETRTGDIYAGGASEILMWNGSEWAVVSTAPITLSENVTSAVLMGNDDILFGGNNCIIRRNSDGTWDTETMLPTGQVWGMVLTSTGLVYAADNGRILKRGTDESWSVDTTLPHGQVYSFTEYRTGRVFAGCDGEILKTADPSVAPDELSISIASGADEAEQWDTFTYSNPTGYSDLDFFNRGWVGLRFKLDVASGSVINTARVDVTATHDMPACYNTPYSTETCHIYCEDIDNSPAFASSTNNISSRTRTSAYEPWAVTVLWRGDYNYSSPDIRAVLQEVIDRPGWVSGNYVSIIFRSQNVRHVHQWARREAFSYVTSPDRAARLVVNYTTVPSVDTNWERCSSDVTANIRSMLSPACSPIVLAGDNGVIRASDDEGLTWGVISATPSSEVTALYEHGDHVYAGENGNILRSPDCGRNWITQSALPGGYVYDFVGETATGDLRSGDNGQILLLDTANLEVVLGRSDEDVAGTVKFDEVFAANHHKTCNLTNIHIVDGGWVGGNIFPLTTFPTSLFPAVPAVDDATYFGAASAVTDTGPFCNLIFDIATVARSTVSYTIVWEYWNGGWVTLTTTDETNQFSEPGVKGVFWDQPTDWATTNNIVGVTGYWVRARVSAVAGVLTPPTQQNRSIYTSSSNFVEVNGAQMHGNIASLIKMFIHQRADKDGVGGSAPNLYANRVWCGAKEYVGHENFRAFLNCADNQNPEGIAVSTDATTTIQADTNLSSATGERAWFDGSAAAADTFGDRITFEIDTELASQYYGTYLPIVRCYQTDTAGDASLRIKVVSGTGGISKVGDTKVTQSTTDNELIVFDEPITIPVSSQMKDTDIGDVTSIIIQIATAAAGTPDLYVYDLFLFPTDGPWLDLKDTANTAYSELGNGQRLLVDSISIPKSPTRAIVQTMASDSFVSSWRVNGNGPARLPANVKLRLWFLQARTSAAASTLWLSEPEQCMSLTIQATDRWLLGRGAR